MEKMSYERASTLLNPIGQAIRRNMMQRSIDHIDIRLESEEALAFLLAIHAINACNKNQKELDSKLRRMEVIQNRVEELNGDVEDIPTTYKE